MRNHLSIILLPTNKCNVNCEVAPSLDLNRSSPSMAGLVHLASRKQ